MILFWDLNHWIWDLLALLVLPIRVHLNTRHCIDTLYELSLPKAVLFTWHSASAIAVEVPNPATEQSII